MKNIKILIALTLLQIAITFTNGWPVMRKKKDSTAKRYLSKYGYRDSWSARPSKQETKRGILRLQAFAGIPQSGEEDDATLNLMKKKRCGLADPRVLESGKLLPMQNTKWLKGNLTWNFGNHYSSMREIHSIYQTAFDIWSSITNIDFTEVGSGPADILVKFVRGYHFDPFPFDGEGGAISHVFYPLNNKGLSGDIHFDIDDMFIPKSNRRKYMLWTALHNVGHSLGLEHSNLKTSVMYPWYVNDRRSNELDAKDVDAIQKMYGVRARNSLHIEKTTDETLTEGTAEEDRHTLKTTTESTAENETNSIKNESLTNVKKSLPKTTTMLSNSTKQQKKSLSHTAADEDITNFNESSKEKSSKEIENEKLIAEFKKLFEEFAESEKARQPATKTSEKQMEVTEVFPIKTSKMTTIENPADFFTDNNLP